MIQPDWAEWEAGFVLSGLRRTFGRSVKIATPDGQPQQSIGGIRAAADLAFKDVVPQAGDILLLIGSDAWMEWRDEQFFDMLRAADSRGCIIGAICSGTVALARAGLLAERCHTSNGRNFLMVNSPDYAGSNGYVETAIAVTDGTVVTASGLSALTFACSIFRLAEPGSKKPQKYFEFYAEECRVDYPEVAFFRERRGAS